MGMGARKRGVKRRGEGGSVAENKSRKADGMRQKVESRRQKAASREQLILVTVGQYGVPSDSKAILDR